MYATMILSLGKKGKDVTTGALNYTRKKEKEIARCRVKCKCGCTTLFTAKTDWCICRWCKHKLYRDNQTEFRYNLEEKMKGKRKWKK